jgi:hypothetical protein
MEEDDAFKDRMA